MYVNLFKGRNSRLFACALAGVLLAAAAQAQGWRELPAGKWWKNPEIVRQLALSPEQQDRIEVLWLQHRQDLIDLKAELDKTHLELSQFVSRDSTDEAAALQLFDKAQRARLAIERTTFLMRIRIKNMLSPDQQQRLEQLSTRFRRPRRQ